MKFYIFIMTACLSFVLGLHIGGEKKVRQANKVVTVIDNPNCLDGRMK